MMITMKEDDDDDDDEKDLCIARECKSASG